MAQERTKTEHMTRRGLLGHLARLAGLAAVTLGAGTLIGRRVRRGAASGGGSLCARCPVFEGCRLPEARTQRRKGLGIVTPVRRSRQGSETSGDPICAEGKVRQTRNG